MISLQIENAMAVQTALNNFEKKISKKVVKDAISTIMKPMQREAKRNAKSLTTGKIAGVKKAQRMGSIISKYLVLQALTTQKLQKTYGRDAWGMQIRPKAGVKEFSVRAKYSGEYNYIPSAIEYGHAHPYLGGTGSKDVAARPFIRPVWDKYKPHLPKDFEKYLDLAIAEENRKR